MLYNTFEIKEIPKTPYGQPTLQNLRAELYKDSPLKVTYHCFDFVPVCSIDARTRPGENITFKRQENDMVNHATPAQLQELRAQLKNVIPFSSPEPY